jgi:hypothetical protein
MIPPNSANEPQFSQPPQMQPIAPNAANRHPCSQLLVSEVAQPKKSQKIDQKVRVSGNIVSVD